MVFLMLAACVASTAQASSFPGYPTGKWRYRLTIQIETPEGIKTGSAIREVTVETGPNPLPEMQPTIKLRGESVIVDLGKRGIVFGTLDTYSGVDMAADLPIRVFPFEGLGYSERGITYYSKLRAGPKELVPEQYPRLVYFSNLKDPKTAKSLLSVQRTTYDIDVSKVTEDNFEKVLGKGVHLKSITIEMTGDPVTFTDIRKILPWLPDYYGRMLDGRRYNTIKSEFPFANSLTSSAFSTKVTYGR